MSRHAKLVRKLILYGELVRCPKDKSGGQRLPQQDAPSKWNDDPVRDWILEESTVAAKLRVLLHLHGGHFFGGEVPLERKHQ